MSVVIDRYRNKLEVYINNLPLIDGHTGKIASFKEGNILKLGIERGGELERVLTFLIATTPSNESSRTQSPGD